jgi:predicted Zn-dependent protease
VIEKLKAMLESGNDSSTLRFSLANAYLKDNDPHHAVEHALIAVEQAPDYSAAWRLLGQAQLAAGKTAEAAESFERGIEVAQRVGDRQVGKEMQVFLRRLRKAASGD